MENYIKHCKGHTASSFGEGMLWTEDKWEKVACNAVVDFVMSQRARVLFSSPNSSVCRVIVANAVGSVCDVGRTKRWVTSPPKSRGSRFTSNVASNRTGVPELVCIV